MNAIGVRSGDCSPLQMPLPQLGVPLDINETYYDHADLFHELSPKVAGEELNSIRALLVFPRRSKSYCQIDVDAPYDMAAIGAAIEQCGQQR